MRTVLDSERWPPEDVVSYRLKLLVIGIDGFSSEFFDQYLPGCSTWDWLYEKIEDGEAYKETLHSTGEAISPETELSAIYTGEKPEREGIKYYSEILKKTVFEQIDDTRHTQGVYNMPLTQPAPQPDSGWVISGYPSPVGLSDTRHAPDSMDADAREEIIEASTQARNISQIRTSLPRSDIHSPEKWHDALRESGEYETVVNKGVEIELENMRTAVQLQEATGVDIFFYGSDLARSGGHLEGLKPERSMTQTSYTTMGHVVETLIEKMRPDHWMIVSECGFKVGEREYSEDGVFISSFDHKMHARAENKGLETRDAAWQISYQLGIGDAWIGKDSKDITPIDALQ